MNMATDGSLALIQETLGDKYEIKNLIQAGGMGKIYLGVHKALNKKVAIKIIHQELVKNEQIKSRFEREAKLAAGLDHSGIIDIYDFGSNKDFDYIIMPFIEGETLSVRIKKEGPIPPEDAVKLMIEITEALHYAHTRNVIHRDIKPSNIMFDRQGKTVIADFGISKNMADSDLTAPNTVLGSPRYMSPEQIRGQAVDARSDLYSLGLVFYEMMTGIHPFKEKDATAIFYAQAHEIPPRPETKKPDIPRAMGAIIMKLLEKNPESRYADGAALLKDLRAYRDGKMRPQASEDADATIIDDATLMMDDATRMMGDKPAAETPPPELPDATLVAPAAVSPPPFYKKHMKPLMGAGAALIIILAVLMIFGGGSEDPSRAVPEKTALPTGDGSRTAETTPVYVPETTEILPPEPTSSLTPETPPPTSIVEAFSSAFGGKTADEFSLWTDRDTYRIGENMTFHFESRKPCYAVILGYTTQGDLVQIFPNHFLSSQFIQANRPYSIPDDDMDFDLKVFGPAGQETVVALVSDSPFTVFDSAFHADNPFLSFNETDVAKKNNFYKRLDNIKNKNISQQRTVYRIVN